VRRARRADGGVAAGQVLLVAFRCRVARHEFSSLACGLVGFPRA
jgi:hypothetical protein